jgi:cyd operon protein YbgT
MWYFTWILGVLFACACGIINVMWLEQEHILDKNDADPK